MTESTGNPKGATEAPTSGYALVNSLNMYYEIHGVGVRIGDPAQIDAEMLAWLKLVYDAV